MPVPRFDCYHDGQFMAEERTCSRCRKEFIPEEGLEEVPGVCPECIHPESDTPTLPDTLS